MSPDPITPDPEAFSPIRPNPYIVGTPVRDRAMFFGREAEFELVRKRFSESEHGGLFVFCGERRSGKTSILFQILDRRLGPDFIPVLIDMQSMAVNNEIDFLGRLSREVLLALGPSSGEIAPPEFHEGSNHSATFGRFIQRVLDANPNQKLILLFDEYELFENKIDAGALQEDVLYVLANLIERHSVFVIFTGSQHLDARRAEYWKILGKSRYKTISYLERSDALNLIRRPVEGRLEYEDATVERIIRLTSGQAFYTQAICQNLVDQANEQRSRLATSEILTRVVDNLVENPLPQMIFLWDGLERDEKLVLALLAENLPDENAWATVDHLARLINRRDYPLDLSKPQISTALEKLFGSEMLLRRDTTDPPGYAFRMDLWRLWVRRMHSVWQVMRQEGLKVPRGRRILSRRVAISAAGALVILVLAIAVPAWVRGRRPAIPPLPPPPGMAGPTGAITLEAEPGEALIYLGNRRVGLGSFSDQVPAGVDHRFRLTAAGYVDTELVVHLGANDVKTVRVSLTPLVGDLVIATVPPGAEVRVDGVAQGKSPVTVRGLRAARPAHVEASLAGFGMAQGDFAIAPGKATPVALRLAVGTADLLVTTDPPGAEIRIDRESRGQSPLRLRLPLGRHRFDAVREGFRAAESTLVVTENTPQLDLVLRPAPPGVLVVQGDKPAQIYLNGVLIVENVQNSGPRELPAGSHQVHVVMVSGETIDQAVTIRSGERATFDYSKGVVTRRAP